MASLSKQLLELAQSSLSFLTRALFFNFMVVRASFRMTTGHSKSLDVRGTAEMNFAGPGSGDGGLSFSPMAWQRPQIFFRYT